MGAALLPQTSSPKKIHLLKVHLHLLLGQDPLSAVEPTTVYSSAKTTRDTDRWESQQLGSLMPWPHLFLAIASISGDISRNISTAAKFLGAGAATSATCQRWLALGPELGLCLGASSLLLPGTLLWSNSSSPPPFTFSGVREPFRLMVVFLILCPVKEPSPPPIRRFFSHVSSVLLCSFSYTSSGSLGKVVNSGFDSGKRNKCCINKIFFNEIFIDGKYHSNNFRECYT